MKVTTGDCVEALVKAKGGSPKDWKRRGKTREGADIVRTFENAVTGGVVRVVERPDGSLDVGGGAVAPVAGPVVVPAGAGNLYSPIYYAATLITSKNLEELGMGDPAMLGSYWLSLTTADCWRK
jgi:hypothetical protein